MGCFVRRPPNRRARTQSEDKQPQRPIGATCAHSCAAGPWLRTCPSHEGIKTEKHQDFKTNISVSSNDNSVLLRGMLAAFDRSVWSSEPVLRLLPSARSGSERRPPHAHTLSRVRRGCTRDRIVHTTSGWPWSLVGLFTALMGVRYVGGFEGPSAIPPSGRWTPRLGRARPGRFVELKSMQAVKTLGERGGVLPGCGAGVLGRVELWRWVWRSLRP